MDVMREDGTVILRQHVYEERTLQRLLQASNIACLCIYSIRPTSADASYIVRVCCFFLLITTFSLC